MNGLLSTWLALNALVAGPPCALELSLSPGSGDDLERELEERGLMPLRAATCEGPRVVVTQEANTFVISLRDAGNREHERRTVRRADTVAAVVSSWVREDLVSSLLEVSTPPIPRSAETATAPSAEEATARLETRREASEPDVPSTASTFSLGVGAEAGADTDGELWLGAAAVLRPSRARLAPMFLLRFAHGAVQGSSTTTGTARTGLELLGFAEGNLPLGDFVLRPSAGAGLGLLYSARSLDSACGEVCSPWVEDGFSTTRIGPRLEARLGLTRALGAAAALEVTLSVTFAPLAERAGLVPDYAGDLPGEQDRARFALAAEPILQGRLSLALHWGAP